MRRVTVDKNEESHYLGIVSRRSTAITVLSFITALNAPLKCYYMWLGISVSINDLGLI